MNTLLGICSALFGALVGLVAGGSLHLWPALEVRLPEPSAVALSPLLAFGLLALAIHAQPRFLNSATIKGATVFLILLLAYLLTPSLTATSSTDAQSGMFEALVAMAVLPVVGICFLVAAGVQLVLSITASRNET